MEAYGTLQHPGQHWPEERTQRNAHVIERIPGVTPLVVVRVQHADHGGHVYFQPAGTGHDEDQPRCHPGDRWNQCQDEVAEKDQDGRVENDGPRGYQSVSDPGTHHL